jgi:predicted NBD/HSP70 family sugar kinase
MTQSSGVGRALYLGLDMGGTDIKATISDGEGRILVPSCDKVLSLAAEGPARTIEQLALAATKVLDAAGGTWDQVGCVGLDTPGPATLDGVIGKSPNLKHPAWGGFGIRAAFERHIRRPVLYANDGNAAAYWEYFRLYREDKTKVLAAAILGTGLGGALVWGGHVLTGANGYGAEFGHIRLPTQGLCPDGDVPVCGCGKRACAEAFVSVAALDSVLRKELSREENRHHPLRDIPDQGRARALKLLGLAQAGDALALALFDLQADALGTLFVQLANAFDPHVLIIGGGLTESSESFRVRYLERVKAVFRREAFPLIAEEARIEFAQDQDMAGCRGAALLARQHARAVAQS